MSRATYTAQVEPDSGWWTISVEGVRGAHSQAERLSEAEATVRELLGILLEVPEDSFDVVVEVEGMRLVPA